MKPTDIAKIRQLLKSHCEKCRIRDEHHYIKINACGIENCEINAALALLPCPTCNGTGIKPPKDGCGYCLAVDGHCRADCPCPDCT